MTAATSIYFVINVKLQSIVFCDLVPSLFGIFKLFIKLFSFYTNMKHRVTAFRFISIAESTEINQSA